MNRKQIILRAAIMSILMAMIGLSYNLLSMPVLAKHTVAVETDSAVEIDPRIRSMQEHGEEAPVEELQDIQGEIERREIELEELQRHEGAVGERMAPPDYRVENRKSDLRREIIELRKRQIILLHQYYPPAAGEEEGEVLGADGVEPYILEYAPTESAPDKAVEEPIDNGGFFAGVNARYLLDKLFNGLWLLGQVVVGAWAARKWRANG
jgi:hypothetical protein